MCMNAAFDCLRAILPLPIAAWLALCANASAVAAAPAVFTADYYVAVNGNDAWSGKLPVPNAAATDGPFASLPRAIAAVRQHADRSKPITVCLRGGVYYLAEPLVLGPADSGTALAPVRYMAYPQETPVISAGVRLTDWQPTRVHGQTAWVATAPAWPFRQLWVNGQRRQRPRLPKQGLFTVQQVAPSPSAYVGQNEFVGPPGQMRNWHNLPDVDVVMMTAWVDSRLPVATVDEATGRVTSPLRTALAMRTGAGNPSRFYVDNVFEAFDQPGLWYHDRALGKVFYIPQAGEDPAAAEIVVPRFAAALTLRGDPDAGRFVEHVHFHGIHFAHSEWRRDAATAIARWEIHDNADTRQRRIWVRHATDDVAADMQCAVSVSGAVQAVAARHCRFAACTVAHAGNYGIELGRGCSDNDVAACTLHDLGGGGVKFGTQDVADAPLSGYNRLTDCRIFDVGRLFHAAVGVWLGETGNNTVAHNDIHDLYYSGISVGWTWGYQDTGNQNNLVEYNHVYDVGKGWLFDMGGLYNLGRAPGTVFRYNRVHDVRSDDLGAVGLYFDEGTSHVLAENNLVYNIDGYAFEHHYGAENVVRNNIFAGGKRFQLARGRAENHVSFTAERNIFYFTEGALLGYRWDDGRYRMRANLYWNPNGAALRFAEWSWDQWRAWGNDAGGLVADPRFVAPARGDFTLPADSPARQIGFVPWDLSQVGPREEANVACDGK